MGVDVLKTLRGFENGSKTAIDVDGATVTSTFGNAIGTVITNIFSGSVQLGNPNYVPASGGSTQATVTGSGLAAPLLSQFQQMTFTFRDTSGGVEMDVSGKVIQPVKLPDAWPVLQGSPLSALTLSGTLVPMTVQPGDTSFDLDISGTASYNGLPVGPGLLQVSYEDSKLGFLGGFIDAMSGNSWTPYSLLPVLGTLGIKGQAGVFFSTVTATDLSAFQSLHFPYPPTEIDPGLTFLALISLAGSLKPIADILPSGTTLELLANIPNSNPAEAKITASIGWTPNNDFTFKLDLVWKSITANGGTIAIEVDAIFNDIFNNGGSKITLSGDVEFIYGTQPSLDGEIVAIGDPGLWTHPFGIPNLVVDDFSLGFALTGDGITLEIGGTITVGEGSNPVVLDVAGGITDFEAPTFFAAALSASSKDKVVTLPQLISDFIPLLPDHFPLLDHISFSDLEIYAAAETVEIEGKTYHQGVGATGDIDFFGLKLDFAFSLITNPRVAVKARGSISDGNGPIVISAGGVNVLTLSDSTGQHGPSACIDTTGSDFCGDIMYGGTYFVINAKVSLLGLVNASVVAEASTTSFEFDMDLNAANIFSEDVHVEFIPNQRNFLASLACKFTPPDITLGPLGVIPKFTIPIPKIDLCVALGNFVTNTAPCADGWTPKSAPFFRFELMFSWGAVDFSLDVELDLSQVTGAFTNFSSWILNYVENHPGEILDAILKDATKLAKLLLVQLGETFDEVVRALQTALGWVFEKAFDFVSDIAKDIENCAVSIGNGLLGLNGDVRKYVPQFEVDLIEIPAGRSLLYHYYLNKPALQLIIQSNTPIGEGCRTLLASSVQNQDAASGSYIHAVIELLKASEAEGDADFRASATEVVGTLERYRNMTYPEFLSALRG